MAIVSKAKITYDGKLKADELIEIEDGPVAVNAAGKVKATEFIENVEPVQFGADGTAKAVEFVEY